MSADVEQSVVMNYKSIFKEFLEASTIHGLVYIPSGNRFIRLFWIVVVITGFSIASVLIHQSFDNWSSNPVKTTIETRPISDLRFPVVTVCPPKNSFTNLNYDIKNLEDVEMSRETRDEVLEIVLTELYDSYHDDLMTNMTKLEDDDRYRGWYHGRSNISFPYWSEEQPNTWFITSYQTGSIQTKYFGETYNSQFLESSLYYNITIPTPDNIQNNVDYELRVELEWVHMLVPDTSRDIMKLEETNIRLVSSYGSLVKTYIGPKEQYSFYLDRAVTDEDISKNSFLGSIGMPGFKIKWYYNKKVLPDGKQFKFFYQKKNQEFRRLVNIVHQKSEDVGNIWKAVRKVRMNFLVSFDKKCSLTNPIIRDNDIMSLVTNVQKELGLVAGYDIIDDVPHDTIDTAGEMFAYLIYCPQEVLKLVRDLIQDHPPNYIIITLNRLAKILPDKHAVFLNILEKLTPILDLKFQDIAEMSGTKSCEGDCSLSSDLFTEDVLEMTNHPVHILKQDGSLSPTSLIPFCWIGIASNHGEKIDQFDEAVCDTFKPKLRQDQICYEMDSNLLIDNTRRALDMKVGLYFVIDENRDREVDYNVDEAYDGIDRLLEDFMYNLEEKSESKVYLDTVGKETKIFYQGSKNLFNFRFSSTEARVEIQSQCGERQQSI